MPDVLTPHDVNQGLLAIVEAMRRISAELRRSIQEYVQAEQDWKLAEARAMLEAEGKSSKDREAAATVSLIESGAYWKWRVAELTRKAGERELRSAEAALSAQQTIAATMRNEMRLAGFEPS